MLSVGRLRAAEDTAESAPRMAVLFREHSPAAVRLAFLMTGDQQLAEDVVQDSFVRVFSRWQDLRNREAFRGYLHRTVINLTRNQFRRQALHRRHLERQPKRLDAGGFPDIEGRDELLAALMRLPHRQRAVIVLRYLEDLSEQHTADALGCSLGAVKSAAGRALAALKKDLGEES
jgi:RNA polymerase sigma-70 factor (sigma-E family)